MRCSKCSTELADNQYVCPNCGTIADMDMSDIIDEYKNNNEEIKEKSKETIAEKTQVFSPVNEEKENLLKNAPYVPPLKPQQIDKKPNKQKHNKEIDVVNLDVDNKKKNKKDKSTVKTVILSMLLVITIAVCAYFILNALGYIPEIKIFEKETTVTTVAETATQSEFAKDYDFVTEGDHVIITKYKGNETSVIIPKEINNKKVTEIGEKAFYENSTITSLTMQNSVITIGESAFAKCTGLSLVTIPDSVCVLKDECFYGCTALTYIKISGNISTIGRYVFGNCNNLTVECSVTSSMYDYCKKQKYKYKLFVGETEPSQKSVDENATTHISKEKEFVTKKIKGGVSITGYKGKSTIVVIPKRINKQDVVSIGENAFKKRNIKSLVIPETVKEINNSAFSGCSNLSIVEIQSKDITFSENCFDGCENMTIKAYRKSTSETFAIENNIPYILL